MTWAARLFGVRVYMLTVVAVTTAAAMGIPVADGNLNCSSSGPSHDLGPGHCLCSPPTVCVGPCCAVGHTTGCPILQRVAGFCRQLEVHGFTPAHCPQCRCRERPRGSKGRSAHSSNVKCLSAREADGAAAPGEIETRDLGQPETFKQSAPTPPGRALHDGIPKPEPDNDIWGRSGRTASTANNITTVQEFRRSLEAVMNDVDRRIAAEPSSIPSCTPPLEPPRNLSMGIISADVHANVPPCGRFIASNHKTGTWLSACLAKTITDHGEKRCAGVEGRCGDGVRVQRLSGAYPGHVSGGYVSTAWQVNMIRSPFVLVHSGYNYHRSTPRPEPWTMVPFAVLSTRTHAGAWGQFRDEAVAAWQGYRRFSQLQGCGDGVLPFSRTVLNTSVSYRGALNLLTRAEGLLFESMRSLHRDVPYVVASSISCGRAQVEAQAAFANRSSTCGGCTNVWLDEDIMADFDAGLRRLRHPLALPGSQIDTLARLFQMTCDPASKQPSTKGTRQANVNHRTDHTDRVDAIALLRQIDVGYLGSKLHKADTIIRSLAREVRTGTDGHVRNVAAWS